MFFLFSLILSFPLFAKDSLTEQQKIEALLQVVKVSDVTFIRNGKEYPATEAYEHLKMKLRKAQGSWFAPSKDKWTALLFIEKVASKSSLSGDPYLIRTKDGKTVEAKGWLEGKLHELEARD